MSPSLAPDCGSVKSGPTRHSYSSRGQFGSSITPIGSHSHISAFSWEDRCLNSRLLRGIGNVYSVWLTILPFSGVAKRRPLERWVSQPIQPHTSFHRSFPWSQSSSQAWREALCGIVMLLIGAPISFAPTSMKNTGFPSVVASTAE
jgi:hypothetical protein